MKADSELNWQRRWVSCWFVLWQVRQGMKGSLEASRLRMVILDRFVPPGIVSINPAN